MLCHLFIASHLFFHQREERKRGGKKRLSEKGDPETEREREKVREIYKSKPRKNRGRERKREEMRAKSKSGENMEREKNAKRMGPKKHSERKNEKGRKRERERNNQTKNTQETRDCVVRVKGDVMRACEDRDKRGDRREVKRRREREKPIQKKRGGRDAEREDVKMARWQCVRREL